MLPQAVMKGLSTCSANLLALIFHAPLPGNNSEDFFLLRTSPKCAAVCWFHLAVCNYVGSV